MSNAEASALNGADSRPHEAAPVSHHRHLLALRFALFNVVALGLGFATYLQGWLDGALAEQTRWPTFAIVATFCYGLLLCTARIHRTGRLIERVRAGPPPRSAALGDYLHSASARSAEQRSIAANLLRLRLSHPNVVVRHVANSLVFLGLIGTVIGFIIALSGVNPEQAGNIDNVAPMVSTLISGMSIALYTTLVGAVLHLWLMVCYRMLVTATIELFDAVIERGERDVER